MKTISRYIMTLALLLTAVTGAWADETPLVTINASSDFTSGSKTFDNKVNIIIEQGEKIAYVTSKGWYKSGSPVSMTIEPVDGVTISKVKLYFSQATPYEITSPYIVKLMDNEVWNNPLTSKLGEKGITMIEVYGIDPNAVEVTPVAEPAAHTKQWTFNQPGSDVVLTPVYAPTAAWAEVESVKQLPAAAEGVIAGTDAPLIVEGIVAFAGTSAEVTQGTVMYAVTPATVTEAPALTAFSADVPTAKDIADDGADVLVWYYIQGADTPDGQQATADNTFNNSDVASLKVSVRSNKFDLAFKAANANTVEAGMATVTVGGTAATVTDGKLQGVKMGSEVKMTAKEGYKFRKVEATKGISTLKSVKIGNYTVYYAEGETWYQAFWRDENNNCGLETSVGRVFTYNDKSLRDSGGDVYADAVIDPSRGYYIAD